MMPAQIIVEIVEEGGEIRLEDGRLKVKGIPARLVPLIREHKAALLALLKDAPQSSPPEQTDQRSTPSVSVDSEQDMALPERVTCGSCVRFQPGTTSLGVGSCLATVTGQPPAGNRGDYRAAFPMAPRRCPEYAGSLA